MVRGWTLCSLVAVTLAWSVNPLHAAVTRGDAARGSATRLERPSQPTTATVDELLELSGLKAKLETLSAGLRAQLQRAHKTEQEQAIVDRVAARHLGTEILYARVRIVFEGALGATTRDGAIAWYRSPLGRRIVAAERDVLGLDGVRVTVEPPSADRMVLLERLDEASGGSQAALDIVMALSLSLARITDQLQPAHARLGPERLERRYVLARLDAAPTIRRVCLANMLVAYRDLADAELAAYARWVESSEGRWFMDTMNRAVVDAVRIGAELAAVELVTLLPQTVDDRP